MGDHRGQKPSVEARQRILHAAEKLFAEKGFAATRVQEITDAAGVNKALLYYYFQDKQAVYAALLEDGIEAFVAVLDAALGASGTYPERLRGFVHGHVDLLWKRPDLLRVVQRSQMAGEVDEVDLRAVFQEPMTRLERFFAAGCEAGEFRALDPRMSALSLVALANGFATYRTRGLKSNPTEVAEHITRLVLDGIRTGSSG